MRTLLATTSSFATEAPEIESALAEQGFCLVVNPLGRKLTEQELCELLDCHKPVGLLAGTEPITDKALTGAKDHLRVVSRVGVGWENVDRLVAAELGITVCRTEGVLAQAVAELTIGFMLSALRAIPLQDRLLRQGVWKKPMGSLLSERTVGLVGFGSIGRRVGELARAFGARVLYHDPVPADLDWAEPRSYPDLLAEADIVSLHADCRCCLIGEPELERMKPGAILVNTARGTLVDEAALARRLDDGRIGWACLDVYEREPYAGPLAQSDRAILTCHIGSYAREARLRMELAAVENLMRELA